MIKSERIKRNMEIIAYLKTPLKDKNGRELKDKNGQLVYPSLEEAAHHFNLSWSMVWLIKKQYG